MDNGADEEYRQKWGKKREGDSEASNDPPFSFSFHLKSALDVKAKEGHNKHL